MSSASRSLGVIISLLAFSSLPSGMLCFCVYNDNSQTYTVYQLPISPGSYKAVVKAGDKNCCNYNDCYGDKPGRCSQTIFCASPGAQDTKAVTAAEIIGKINSIATKSLAFIPGVGALDEANSANLKQLVNGVCSTYVQAYNGGIVIIDGKGGVTGPWSGSSQKPPDGTC